MNETELINKIIEQTDLTKEEIKNLIKEKNKEYRNFLTTQAAYSHVCEDLKINLNNKESKKEESNMKDEEVKTIKPESGLREIDKKMALTVHDENEGVSVKNELIITHYPSEEEILFLIKKKKLKRKIIMVARVVKITNPDGSIILSLEIPYEEGSNRLKMISTKEDFTDLANDFYEAMIEYIPDWRDL